MGEIERNHLRQPGYSEQQVKEILTRAMELPEQQGETFSREQVVELAGELGISAAQLARAERAWLEERREGQLAQQQKAFIASRRRTARNSIVGYVVMGSLVYLAFLSQISLLTMAATILMVPLFVIGIVLFFEVWEAIFDTEGEDFDKAFAKWQERREKQLARLQPPSHSLGEGRLVE